MEVTRLGTRDLAAWDAFVAASPQGTPFSTTAYLRCLDNPHSIYCVREAGRIEGGIVCLERPESPDEMYPATFPFVPYQGILIRDASEMRTVRRIDFEFGVTKILVEHLARTYRTLYVANSWELADLRPFTWHTYFEPDRAKRFRAEISYTALLDISDPEHVLASMRKTFRQTARKAEAAGMRTDAELDLDAFLSLYGKTFEKQGIALEAGTLALVERIFRGMAASGDAICFVTRCDGRAVSAAYFLFDRKRAYYLFGCSDPAYLPQGCAVKSLLDSFSLLRERGHTEVDMVGVNSPRRGSFKLAFGGRLRSYVAMALGT